MKKIIHLSNTKQRHDESVEEFIKRFRDFALDCYEEQDEQALVDICIDNIIADYRVHLENL